jgi:hypothetical protein
MSSHVICELDAKHSRTLNALMPKLQNSKPAAVGKQMYITASQCDQICKQCAYLKRGKTTQPATNRKVKQQTHPQTWQCKSNIENLCHDSFARPKYDANCIKACHTAGCK